MSEETPVLITLEDGIGELVLNRPERRNSLTGPLVSELRTGLVRLNGDEECRAIIIRGQEGYFCAGLDLKAFAEEPPPGWRRSFHADWVAFHGELYKTDKPVIGALERFAIAGGSALAFACDYLIMGERAFIHAAEVERGMVAPVNAAWLMLRHGYHRALAVAVVGDRIYGEEALRLGLVTRVVPDEQVLAEARGLAQRLAGMPKNAVQGLKASIRRTLRVSDFGKVLERGRGD